MKAVASRENPSFKAVARLVSSASERRRSGLSVLDGAHLLAAFLDAGHRPEQLFVSRSGLEDAEVARLVARASPTPVVLLADALFDALSTVESPTGVLCVARTPAAQEPSSGASLTLLLEDVQDPGNVGTLLRAAAAAGADQVLLSPKCAFAWSPKVLRAGMGAHFALRIVEGADLAAFLGAFRGMSVALAGTGARSLYDIDLRGPAALALGNEGAGLSPAVAAAARERAAIPMAGRVESLNVAAAGSIALFEAVRQRRTKGTR